ncbi:MAG: site-specific integrase, partial [Nitrososphaeria archaeon]
MKDEKVKRWYENLEAKSVLTATTWLRTLGYYCELEHTTPKELLEEMKKPEYRNTFLDFVRKLEKEGKAGSYIYRFKNTLRSFSKFNQVNVNLEVNIKGKGLNPTIDNERVP